MLTNQNKGNKEILETAKTLLKLSKDESQRKKLELIIASKEDVSEDLSEFDTLIASKNGDINALLKSTALAMSDNDFSKSVALLNAVEKIDAFQYDMLSMKMSLLKMNKGEEKAMSFLKNKLKNSPKNLNVLLLLINENLKIEKNEAVKKYTLLAQKHHPKAERLQFYINYVRTLDLKANSEKEFEKLIAENPKDIFYLRAYADWLVDNNKLKKSIKQEEEILRIDANNLTALLSVSQTYSFLENTKKQKNYIDKALVQAPLKTLNFLLKTDRVMFKKYLPIAVAKNPDNTELIEWAKMVEKMI